MIYKVQAILIILFMTISIAGATYLSYNSYNDDKVICSKEVSLEDCEEHKKILQQRDR